MEFSVLTGRIGKGKPLPLTYRKNWQLLAATRVVKESRSGTGHVFFYKSAFPDIEIPRNLSIFTCERSGAFSYVQCTRYYRQVP